MKVSIIIPVFNVATYIESCLLSVVNQTYKNIECILIDDCGTDNSIIICKQFINTYNGNISFKLIHHLKNKGLSEARNTGIQEATGEYIFFLDSDDTILPHCIEDLIHEVYKHPGVELVQGETISQPMNNYYSYKHLKDIDYIDSPFWMRKFYFNTLQNFPVNAWNKLIKKQFLIDNRIFFKKGLIHEDQLWMYWLSLHLTKLAIVHKKTYFHLTTPNSIMTTATIERTVKNWNIIFSEITNNLRDPYSDRVLLFYLKIFIHLYKTNKISRYTLNAVSLNFKKQLKERSNLFIYYYIFVFFLKFGYKLKGMGRFFDTIINIYFKNKTLKKEHSLKK